MAGEYDHITTGRLIARDYVALTGDMAASNTVDLNHDLIGVNVSAAGNLKIDTANGTTITIHVVEGDNGTAPIRRIHVTGTTATIAAGII